MSTYAAWLARNQDRHDSPDCDDCGRPTWRGDLIDGLCADCHWFAAENAEAQS